MPSHPPRDPDLPPRLISVQAAARRAGVCRSSFYLDWVPRLKTVRYGRRQLVDVASLDRLIDELVAGTTTIKSTRAAAANVESLHPRRRKPASSDEEGR
jgi:hypothetical protein